MKTNGVQPHLVLTDQEPGSDPDLELDDFLEPDLGGVSDRQAFVEH
jgi:hypothetical protein